jgi:hypothetical protein
VCWIGKPGGGVVAERSYIEFARTTGVGLVEVVKIHDGVVKGHKEVVYS